MVSSMPEIPHKKLSVRPVRTICPRSCALGITGLVRVVVVKVELLEDRQIFSGLRGVVHFLFLLCAVRCSLKVGCRFAPCTRCMCARLFLLVGVGSVAPSY